MPAPQFQAPIPVPIQGYRPDLSPREIGPLGLYQAQNFIVRDGVMQSRPGFSNKIGTAFSQRPQGYVQYKHTDGVTRIVMGTTVGWRKYNSGTTNWDDISGTALTGLATNQQVFRVFQKGTTSHLLGCNGADVPEKWDGVAATYSAIGGTPPKSVGMMVLADRVMLLNLLTGGAGATASPVGYDVSNALDFDTGWGSAQFGLLADTPGPITGGMEFGNLQGAIYKSDAIVMAIAQGGLAPFSFQWRVTGVAGPLSPLSIIPITENLHAYLGADGAVYLFDGVTSKSVGYHVQKHILNTGDMFALDRSYGFWDFERQELWFFYPEAGSLECNVSAVINLVTGTFESGVRTGALWPMRYDPAAIKPVMGAKLKIASSITWSQTSGAYSDQTKTYAQFDSQIRRIVLGDLAGQNYTDIASGDGPSAAAVTSFWESGLSDLSSPGNTIAFNWKTITLIDNFFQPTAATQNVTMSVGKTSYGEARVLDGGRTMDLSTASWWQSGHRVTGRLLSYRVDANVSQPIAWLGAEASISVRGKR